MNGLTPGKAIRAYCLSCCLDNAAEVRQCPSERCPLWPWRFGQRPETRGLARRPDGRTARRAIHAKCRDCHESPRRDCGRADCELHTISRQRFCARRDPSTAGFGDAPSVQRVRTPQPGEGRP